MADTVAVLAAVSAASVPIEGFATVRAVLIGEFVRHVAHDPAPVLRDAATARLNDPKPRPGGTPCPPPDM